ncbi:hypothetical protein H0H92_011839 [Tricholoma furcatifolium]|nr:hypothetical protein H0H92_011839 [Tricholoma furcatifolium]
MPPIQAQTKATLFQPLPRSLLLPTPFSTLTVMGKSTDRWCQAPPRINAQKVTSNPFASLSKCFKRKTPTANASPPVELPQDMPDTIGPSENLVDEEQPTFDLPLSHANAISDAQEHAAAVSQDICAGVWANRTRRATVEDYESNEEGEADEDLEADEDEFLDSEDDDPDSVLPAETIDEDFERELAAIAEELSEDKLELLRAFALKVDEHLMIKAFEKLQYTY